MDVRHDDPSCKHYFAKLLLCFAVTHEGQRHQCCMIEYLYRALGQEDGVPLETMYGTLRRKLYEVVASPHARLVCYRIKERAGLLRHE